MGKLYQKILNKDEPSVNPDVEYKNFKHATKFLMNKIEKIMKEDEDYEKVKNKLNLNVLSNERLITASPRMPVDFIQQENIPAKKFKTSFGELAFEPDYSYNPPLSYHLRIFSTKHIYNLIAVPIFYFNSDDKNFYYEKWTIDPKKYSKNTTITNIANNEYNILIEIIKRVLLPD